VANPDHLTCSVLGQFAAGDDAERMFGYLGEGSVVATGGERERVAQQLSEPQPEQIG
jgi:hypothetical protein